MGIDQLTRREGRCPAHLVLSFIGVPTRDFAYTPQVPQSAVWHHRKIELFRATGLVPIIYRRKKDGY